MATARRDERGGWLGYMDATAGDDFDTGASEMVPATELGERDAESIGDGDQSVAATSGIEDHSGGGCSWRRLGNDKGLEALDGLAGADLVGGGEFRFGYAEFAGDGSESVISREAMVSPGVALCFRNESDTLLEQGGGAGGEMQVEGGVGWRDHTQKAWI